MVLQLEFLLMFLLFLLFLVVVGVVVLVLVTALRAENLPKSTLAWYFDYESYGRDIRIDFYNEEEPELTAGEFWCGDENATDKEIGEAVIESCGLDSVSNICYYFDYETYGNDIMNEGDYTFTDNGLVDCSDYDDTLGEDFEKALEEELSEKEKEEER